MYRLSKYNYIVPCENKYIYYNGISRQIFSLNEEEHQRIQEFWKDLISFEINYNSVFHQFMEWGFIVDDKTDEIDILRFRNHKEIYSDRSYRLFINPTLDCNFSCWYCYQKHPKGYMDVDIQERVKKYIVYLIEQERIDSLTLSWFGGEPLLYFYEVVYPISIFAKKICEEHHIPFRNGVTTNASKIDLGIVKKMKEIDFFGFQITIDGDEKRHDKIRNENGKPSFQKIMNNINLLCENLPDVYITLRVNYDNQTLQRSDMRAVFSMIPEKYRSHIGVDFQRVWQTGWTVKGENMERKNLYKECCDLGFVDPGISTVFMLGHNHKCYSDRRYYAEINYDGKVYRCTARGYEDKYVVGELKENGQIIWDEKKLAQCIGKATFENRMCLVCKYLPLCMGPCSQKLIETSEDKLENICYLKDCEVSPEDAIINYYQHKMKILSEKVES